MDSMQIEEFKSLMIDDKVIVGCNEVIDLVKSEDDLLYCLIYLWQQQAGEFRRNLPIEIRDWFITRFNSSCDKYYKGMHFEKDVDLDKLALEDIDFTSCTLSYDVAKDFAYGFKSYFKDNDYICAIYEVYGTKVFDNVATYRDMGEEEVIVFQPKFKLLEILN